jgi:hypothetical protein
MFRISTSALILVAWFGLAGQSSFANCGGTSEQAEDLALERLPASLQSLAKEIQGKPGDDIERTITNRFGSGRDVGSGVRIELWQIDPGVLTYSMGLVSFRVRGETVWLTRTINKAMPTFMSGIFEMYTPPEPQMKYWLGNLSLTPESGFKFVDSGQNLDHRARQTGNFFMKHPTGRFKVQFAPNCSSDTVLERLSDRTILCTVTFLAEDGSAHTIYDVVAYPSERRLAFSLKNRPPNFSMEKGW